MRPWVAVASWLVFVTLPFGAIAQPAVVGYGKSADIALPLPGQGEWYAALSPMSPRLLETTRMTHQGAVVWPHAGVSLVGQGNELLYWHAGAAAQKRITLDGEIAGGWKNADGSVLVQLASGQVTLVRGLEAGLRAVPGPRARQRWQLARQIDPQRLVAVAEGELQLWQRGKTDWSIVARLALGCQAKASALAQRTLLLACAEQGLLAVDVSTRQPRLLGRYSSGGWVVDIHLDGSVAYLANADQGVTVVDVSQPGRMRWLGSNNKFGPAYRISAAEDGLLVQGEKGRVVWLDTQPLAQPQLLSQFYAGSFDEVIADDHAVLVRSGSELQHWRLAGTQMPLLNGSGTNLGGSRRVQIRDNLAYVADWFSGLHIYDIRQPESPRHLSNIHTPGSAKGVLLMDNVAFVGDDDNGLQVIDISDPTTPRWLANLPTAGLAYTMRRNGELLYLADHRGGWNIIDISQPAEPRLVSNTDTPGKAWSLELYQHYVYVADDDTGILIYDVSDPASPRQVGVFQTGGFAEDIVIRGDIGYAAFFDQGLYVLDLKNPASPRIISQLPSYGNARGLFLQGNRLYLADWDAGLLIIDISNLKAPKILAQLDTDGSAWGVEVKDNKAYVMDWWGGVKVVDVSVDTQPQLLAQYHRRGPIEHIAVRQGVAYLLGERAGLQLFDVNNPDGPIWMAGIEVEGRAIAQAVAGKRVYVTTDSGQLLVINVADPFQPVLLSRHDIGRQVTKLRASDQRLVMLDNQGVVSDWDIAADKVPVLMASLDGRYHDIALQAGRLALLSDRLVELYELAPTTRRLLGSAKVMPGSSMVRLSDASLYVAGITSGVTRLRIEPGGQLTEAGQFVPAESLLDLQPAGRELWLSTANTGAMVLEYNGNQPWISQIYPASMPGGRIAVDNQAVFMVGGDRLLSARRLPALANAVEGESIKLHVPEGLPLGRYDVLLQQPGATPQWLDQAIEVRLKLGGKSSFTLEQFKATLKAERQLPIESAK